MRLFEKARNRRHATLPLADVQIDLTRLSYEKLQGLMVVSGVSLVGSAIMLAQYYRDLWLMHLALVMFFVCLARVGMVVLFSIHSRSAMTMQQSRSWDIRLALSLVSFSILMSAATLRNFSSHVGLGSDICIIGTFAFCNGIGERLGIRPWISITGGLFMLCALAVGILQSHEAIMRWADVIVLFYIYSYCKGIDTKFTIIVEQLRSRRKFRELAEQDALTGLSNRRYFTSSLEATCRQQTPFAVLFIDLDRFKYVNDTFGHGAGDTLLVLVANRLKSAVRTTDLVARLGGDEFAILQAPVSNEHIVQGLAERINHSIALPFEIEGHEVSIGASVGIWSSQNGLADPKEVVKKADEALYRVKHDGRGGFSFAATGP